MPNLSVLLGIVGLIALGIIVIMAVVTRYSVATPDQAYVITGRKGKGDGDLSGQKVVTAGGVFVVPFVQQKSVIDLSSQKIEVTVDDAPSKQGIQLFVDAVAMVKVGGDDDSIRLAAQRFPGNTAEKIASATTEVLSGIVRSVVGTLTVEEIMRDRATVSAKVTEETEAALTVQGLVLDTLVIKNVRDNSNYLRDLGRPEAARVAQEAAIAEADARRTAEQRRLAAEQDILIANREFAIQEAQIKSETEAAKAVADAAGPIARAAKEQEILAQQEQVAIRRAALTDKELDTQVRKPADAARYQAEQEAQADRYAQEQRAEADRQAQILAAQAEAERARLTGEGDKLRRTALAEAALIEAQKSAAATAAEGTGERDKRQALAEAVRLEGDAQAAAALAVGSAEATAMDKKAAAFKNYGEAAIMQMLVEVLPKVAHELSAPLSAIDNMTVISTEGASSVTKSVTNNMTQLTQLLKDTLGLDLAALASGFGGGDSSAPTVPSTTVEKAEQNGASTTA